VPPRAPPKGQTAKERRVAATKASYARLSGPRLARLAEDTPSGDAGALVAVLTKAVNGTVPPGAGGGSAGAIDVASVVRNASVAIAPSLGITPENIRDAMLEQGMDYTEPFAPGRPLNPYFGYNRPPRAWNYQVGRNISTRPRQYRVPFDTLTNLIQSYDVAQVCIRHVIDDLRSMPLLFSAQEGVDDDVTADIDTARKFWRRPDGEQSWHEWFGSWAQDIFRYDGGCLYKRRDLTNKVIGLDIVDTRTISPLIDYMGRRPDPPAPAFLQFVQGLPWDWIEREDFIYTRMNPLPEDVYGLAPIEAVLLTANNDLRYQWYWLQYFTDGTVPEGFMQAPPEESNPDDLAKWQETWENFLLGDQAQKVKLRWVPAGSKYEAAKSPAFDRNFPIWLMRHTVAAFGLTPQDMGWTDDVNRSTGETQMDVQFRIGSMPKTIGIEAVLNAVTQEDLGLRVKVKFDTGREKQDRLEEANAMRVYIESGVVSPDEVRQAVFGHKIEADSPIPRFVMSQRLGPIPLSYVLSVGGEVDDQTYAPEPGTIVPSQFVLPGNQAPDPMATDEEQRLQAIAQHSAQFPSEALALPPELKTTTFEREMAQITAEAGKNPELETEMEESLPVGEGGGPTPPPSTAPPGAPPKKPPPAQAVGQGAASPVRPAVAKEAYDFDAIGNAVRQWRRAARDQVRRGRKPRLFVHDDIPGEVSDLIWGRLEGAVTKDQVDAAFPGRP